MLKQSAGGGGGFSFQKRQIINELEDFSFLVENHIFIYLLLSEIKRVGGKQMLLLCQSSELYSIWNTIPNSMTKYVTDLHVLKKCA